MIPITILPQPDDETCGPTSLHAVYHYYGDEISLEQVIKEVTYIEGGGTLAVLLACHALKRGYQAKIYTYNLNIFDPTWFKAKIDLSEKLQQQLEFKTHAKIRKATKAYIEFLKLGGTLASENLTSSLLNRYFNQQIPVLTGLSATYLYQNAREHVIEGKTISDDLRGDPVGHFVVLCGHDKAHDQKILVADPYRENPVAQGGNYYHVSPQRLINSIMLGIVTFDANILIISKGGH